MSIIKEKDKQEFKIGVSAWGFPDDTIWAEVPAEVYDLKEGHSARLFARFNVKDIKMLLHIQPWNGGILVECFMDQEGQPKRYFEQQFSKSQ